MFSIAHTSPSNPALLANLNQPSQLSSARLALGSQPWASDELRWYAIYTRSRHEKRIQGRLDHQALESFLPLYQAVHRWKDRRMLVSLPLFPGYLFVRMVLPEHRRPVIAVPGVVSLVGRPGCPTPIADHEIEGLRLGAIRGQSMMPHPFLTVGRRVRVLRGPLADLEGILVRRKGKSRLILSIQLIARSVALEVEASDVVAAGPADHHPYAA